MVRVAVGLLAASAWLGCARCVEIEASRLDTPPPSAGTADSGVCAIVPEHEDCLVPAPRCAFDEPDCGPQPMLRDNGCYRPGASRTPIREWVVTWDRCSHDGECLTNERFCLHYLMKGADRKRWNLTIEMMFWPSPMSEDLFCGCVEGYCIPFTQ